MVELRSSAFIFQSFQYPLPWSTCPGDGVDNITLELAFHQKECQVSCSIGIHVNGLDTVLVLNACFFELGLVVANGIVNLCWASSATQYFWYRETLNASPDIETLGSFNFVTFGCLLVAWLVVYFCMIKGITENPRVIHITAIYPYVVLFIFFIRAMMLEGMSDGVIYLFQPKWEKLLSPIVWLEAGTQIFFSLGLAFGGLIAYSSYNPVNNNCIRDAILVAATNFSTSIFAGVVIFAIMGKIKHSPHPFIELL
eukprot:maker-scaffold462_size163801-snap-gene-0.43 protein:Tk04581 transcript:maker-scaffold462_size163801-snap-gene-0.43-mRNA-1 annotation:"hypothetical protein DAPPUDRAFT_314911"